MGWLREVESFPGMYGSPWSGNGKPVIGASVRAHVSKILPKKMALEHFPGDRCSIIEKGIYYGLCNPATGRDCLAQHMYSRL